MSRLLKLFGLALTFAPMIACAQQAAEVDSGGVRIVVMGSSTAAGTGPSDPDSAWVSRYRRHLQAMDPQHEVVNLAVGGYTTYHLLPTDTDSTDGRPAPDSAHNITQALAQDPDAIIINLPSNDAANKFSIEAQLANYRRYAGIEPRRRTCPSGSPRPQPRNLDEAGRAIQTAMRDSTYARFGEHAIDFWTGLAEDDATVKPMYDSGDGIHLNSAAHAILFRRVAEADVLKGLKADG